MSVLAELAGLGDLEGFFQARYYHESVNFVRFPLAPFLQPLRFFLDCGPAFGRIDWCPLFVSAVSFTSVHATTSSAH